MKAQQEAREDYESMMKEYQAYLDYHQIKRSTKLTPQQRSFKKNEYKTEQNKIKFDAASVRLAEESERDERFWKEAIHFPTRKQDQREKARL